MRLQYLEVVSSDVDATCSALTKIHGVAFGEPDAGLGNARTAPLAGGGLIGVRASMHDQEEPTVRPYVLVDDIEAAEKTAEAAGVEFLMPTTEIPGHGKFAIYAQDGIQHGLWSSPIPAKDKAVLVQYLEIVSSDLDTTSTTLAKLHGVTFGEPEAMLGNARIAPLEGGGRIGVRVPMADHEQPIVRPYLLVDDIQAAVKVAEAAGAEFAMLATEIPGQGKFAIYFMGGTQYGLWEL